MMGLALGLSVLLAAMQGSGGVGQVFDWRAQADAFEGRAMTAPSPQCFNGAQLRGVNRAGDGALYVQSSGGAIFRLGLAEPCDALGAAHSVAVRAGTDPRVCTSSKASVVVGTAAGERRCALREVRRVTRAEAATLASAAR